MKYETIKIANLFPVNDFQEESIKQIEIHDKVADLRKKVNKKDSRLKWPKVFEEILETGNKLLIISLKSESVAVFPVICSMSFYFQGIWY
mgnify:CR=1 FL=1